MLPLSFLDDAHFARVGLGVGEWVNIKFENALANEQ